mgnify:CR=1 FL=1
MILTPSQETVASIVILDANDNPASIDGVPQWAVSDPNIATVEPSADGRTAIVRPVGGTGLTQISVTCDADLGEGVEPLVGVGDIEVIGGKATVVRLTFAPATEQQQPQA